MRESEVQIGNSLGFGPWSLAIKIDSESVTNHSTLPFFGDIGLEQFQERVRIAGCWLLEYPRANAPWLMNGDLLDWDAKSQ